MTRKFNIGLLVVVIIISTIGIFTYLYINRLIKSSERVAHTNRVLYLLERQSTLLGEVESATRGFLLLRDSSLVIASESSITELIKNYAELRVATSDNIHQQARLDTANRLIQEKIAFCRLIAFYNHSTKRPGEVPHFSDHGVKIMDRYHALTIRMKQEEVRLGEERVRSFTSFAKVSLIMVSLIGLTALTVIGALFLRFVRQMNEMIILRKKLDEQEKNLLVRDEIDKAKDTFMGIASHELKTPLTSAKAFLQLMERSGKVDYLPKVMKQVNKLTELIAALFDISMIQRGEILLQKEKFDISRMIEELIRETDHRGHIISFFASKTPLEVYADRNRIRQVVSSLIDNAVKYSPRGSMVNIEVKSDHDRIEVRVTDQGIGLPSANRERIFERFYRVHDTSASYSGLGTGLYISNEIIKQHGGELSAESIEGQGSVFYFRIPQRIANTKAETSVI